MYEAWNSRATEALDKLWAKEIELHEEHRLGQPGVRRGRPAVRRRLEETTGLAGPARFEVHDITEIGEEVLVALRIRAIGAAAGTLDRTVFHLLRVERDKVARIRVFTSQAGARKAAGLET